MKLPKLTKREQELFDILNNGYYNESMLSLTFIGMGFEPEVPKNCTTPEYLTYVVSQLGLDKKLSAFTEKFGVEEGFVAIGDMYRKYHGSVDEIDAPIWMEPFCEILQSAISPTEINTALSDCYEKKFVRSNTIDDSIRFFNEFFENQYAQFVNFMRKLYDEYGYDEFKIVLIALEESHSVDRSAQNINKDNVLDTLTDLDSGEQIKLAAIALDNMEPNDFKRSLKVLDIKCYLISAGNDLLKYNHMAVKMMQSEMLLLNWLNNVATDDEDPQLFAALWFKSLTGMEPDKTYKKRNFTVEVPKTRNYRRLNDRELLELSETFEKNLSTSEFERASAMAQFRCGSFIIGQEVNYHKALCALQGQGGRKYNRLSIDLLHVLAKMNKFFAGSWLEKLAK